MNKYESVVIINNSLEEAKIKATIEKISDLINKNGKVESAEEVGAKKLTYEIKGQTEGYYVVFTFDAEPSFIVELERIYRITDEIIKFIVIRKEK